MNMGLLLIFLFGSMWLYGALILAIADWRWNLGRVVQYGAGALFSGALVLTGRTGFEWAAPMAVLFAATIFLPRLLQSVIGQFLAGGYTRRARFLQRVLGALQWRSSRALLQQLGRARTLVDAPDPFGTPDRHHAEIAARLHAAPSLRSFLSGEIESLAAAHDYHAAVRLYEDAFGPRLSPGGGLLHVMAICYSEAGDLPSAVRCLRRAEEARAAPEPLDMRRFLAYLHVYARAGRSVELTRLFEDNPRLVAALPPAYFPLWQGMALAAQGRSDEAADRYMDALARVRPQESGLRLVVQQRLNAPPSPSVALDPDTDAMLDRLGELEHRPARSTALFPAGQERLPATWAILAVCALMYVITEIAGSSEDTYTLIRFGANVPDMVRAGEWWRLVSSIFLHVGMMHLFFNLYACYLFGGFVERFSGAWEMWAVFLFSGLCGSAASAFLGAHAVSAGASGGIFGLIAAATLIALRFRGLFPPSVRKMYLFQFLFIIVINFAYGMAEPHIDNLAHAGGFVGGAIVGLLLGPAIGKPWHKHMFRWCGAALLVLTAGAGLIVQANARSGGYPRRMPELRVVSGPNGLWRMQVPSFWVRQNVRLDEVLFTDPMRAELSIACRPGRFVTIPPDPLEKPLLQKEVRFGRRDFLERTSILAGPGEPVALTRYITRIGDRVCVLTLRCPVYLMDDYRALMARLLLGFWAPDAPNAPAIPPDRAPSPPLDVATRAGADAGLALPSPAPNTQHPTPCS